MKAKFKIIIGVLLTAGLYLLDKIPGLMQVTGVKNLQLGIFGIDDALLIAGGSALAGGIANLFGKDDEVTREELMTKYGYTPFDLEYESEKLKRNAADMLSKRRARLLQKTGSLGLDATATNYGTEQDIESALTEGLAGAEKYAADDKRRIAQLLMSLNAGKNKESDISKFFGGAVQGGNLGLNIAKLMGQSSPETAQTPQTPAPQTPGQTGITPGALSPGSNYDTANQTQGIIDPELQADIDDAMKSLQGEGLDGEIPAIVPDIVPEGQYDFSPLGAMGSGKGKKNVKNPFGMTLDYAMALNNPEYARIKKAFS